MVDHESKDEKSPYATALLTTENLAAEYKLEEAKRKAGLTKNVEIRDRAFRSVIDHVARTIIDLHTSQDRTNFLLSAERVTGPGFNNARDMLEFRKQVILRTAELAVSLKPHTPPSGR